MDDLAARLRSIPTFTAVYAWPERSVIAPAAFIDYPADYDFDGTYARGMDRMTIPAVVLVGRLDEGSSRDELSEYMDGSGAKSIKAVLESGSYTAFDSLRVTGVEIQVMEIAGTRYLAAEFSCDIVGSGA